MIYGVGNNRESEETITIIKGSKNKRTIKTFKKNTSIKY